jgi:D-threo-aldose 1-dehydrogenase
MNTAPPRSRCHLDLGCIGLGGAPIGGFRFSRTDDEGVATVREGANAGIRYFDTSPQYGYGRSELLMGFALRGLPRASFVLSTKVGRVMKPLALGEQINGWRSGGLNFKERFDYTYEGAIRSLEQSYLRLGLSYIDIALIHDCDAFTHQASGATEQYYRHAVEGAWRALLELKKSGDLQAIGVGLNEVPAAIRFMTDTDIDYVMLAMRYTLIDQSALKTLLPLATRKNVSVLVAAPFNSGILATGTGRNASFDYAPAPAEVIQRVQQLERLCARYDIPLQAAALQFPLAHPAVQAVVPGAVSREQVVQNVKWLKTNIPHDFWQEVKSEGLIDPESPLPQ